MALDQINTLSSGMDLYYDVSYFDANVQYSLTCQGIWQRYRIDQNYLNL